MRALGRKGGSRSPLTKLRKAADDELRDKAKAALVDALDGDDEKRRFEAAKSLYSFRAVQPPAGGQAQQQSRGKPVGLAALLEVAAQCKILSQLGLDPAAEAGFLEALRARKSPDVDDAVHIGPTPVKENGPTS
jgi:hypothetical protein